MYALRVRIILGSSTGDADELSAAAAWLYKATGEAGYLNEAKSFYPAGTAWGFAWNDANVGAAVRNHPYHIYILLYLKDAKSVSLYKSGNMLSILNKLTLQKEYQTFVTDNVFFLTKK